MFKKITIFFVSLFSILLVGCGRDFFVDAAIPDLAGVWGSFKYSRSEYSMEIKNPQTGKVELLEFPAVEFSISPKDTTYTMFKFEGDEVWLMKDSPLVDATPGEPYECVISDNDMVSSPLFPKLYEKSSFQITDLTDKYFKLIHIQDGYSIATGDSLIHGYKAEVTFRRLK